MFTYINSNYWPPWGIWPTGGNPGSYQVCFSWCFIQVNSKFGWTSIPKEKMVLFPTSSPALTSLKNGVLLKNTDLGGGLGDEMGKPLSASLGHPLLPVGGGGSKARGSWGALGFTRPKLQSVHLREQTLPLCMMMVNYHHRKWIFKLGLLPWRNYYMFHRSPNSCFHFIKV